jgi:hypothetical protein
MLEKAGRVDAGKSDGNCVQPMYIMPALYRELSSGRGHAFDDARHPGDGICSRDRA